MHMLAKGTSRFEINFSYKSDKWWSEVSSCTPLAFKLTTNTSIAQISLCRVYFKVNGYKKRI